MRLIYIGDQRPHITLVLNLSVVFIRKPAKSHHEVVSYLSTGLGTELLSCNSACLWCKSPLSSLTRASMLTLYQTSCVARAIKKTGCAPNDSPCICNSEHYAGYLQYCFSKKCSAGDDAGKLRSEMLRRCCRSIQCRKMLMGLDALKSATEICHIVSHKDEDDSNPKPADELKKRDAQPWGNWRPSSSQPAQSNVPGKPPGQNNWPAPPKPTHSSPKPTPPPPKPIPPPPKPTSPPPKPAPPPPRPTPPKPPGGGPKPPPPPPPHQTTTKSKYTTKPWSGYTTKTKPTTTQPWHQTTPPHTTKTQTWYTPTQNPTVLAGILPGIVPDIVDGILGNLGVGVNIGVGA